MTVPDYFLNYRERFARAARELEADVAATLAFVYRPGSPDLIGHPAPSAHVRAKGGRFGTAGRAPVAERGSAMLPQDDFDALVAAFSATGFSGADAWYMNDAANLAFAGQAPDFGRLRLPGAVPARGLGRDLRNRAEPAGQTDARRLRRPFGGHDRGRSRL